MTTYTAVYSTDEAKEKTVFPGRVQFVREYDEFFDYLHQGGGTAYQSRVLYSPSMEDAFDCFKESTKVTGNVNHLFFEGVRYVRTVRGVAVYAFDAGS